ncbi:hypothetical protein SS1G_05961 [Sclerotinia sclerotiorum 1980 UF-70]|uniref:Uncharacterized protein n=1 Tax=Sclerotinia sclerotiorum (strain ATCC 18683 / 1980 / Ss-1) TaxID=665079 RepID=A7EKW4_SCLS1|nr:hypothetical protein SS1G_05961 [Sclerotinia sclerotiorum 1980 UF-70]EDO03480.1 hypothetical protein SS1G_05961 [Sclerotinia sclerotiorum 1980 UF-70]
MAYSALDQTDHDKDHHDDHEISSASSNSPFQGLLPSHLFLDAQNSDTSHSQTWSPENPQSLSQMVQSITSKSTKTSASYDILEEDDYEEHEVEREQTSPSLALSPERKNVTLREESPPEKPLVVSIPRPLPRQNTATRSSNNTTSPISPRAVFPIEPASIVRTASGHSIALRHPTPDLQTLQGAYVGNIDKLERTAERLSMTSSIDDAIRELHMEQKRSDSRRSSILSQLNEMPQVSREVSNPSSIIELNNAARSGGYSPAGYMMSPKGSFSTTTLARSASKSSRFGNRPEPELEGRPLDSFVNISFPSLVDNPTPSIAEQDERSATLTRPAADNFGTENMAESMAENMTENVAENMVEQVNNSRPQTSTSTNTFDQAERMFADFDGVHSAPLRTSFDYGLEGQSSAMELKDQSAVATLDSILDASAHAPVTAFVDHAIAGHLGSEVYGKSHQRIKSNTQLLTPDKQDKQDGSKKRTSSFNFLLGRRGSSNNLLGDNDKRAASMTNIQVERKATRSPIEDDEDDINNKDTTPLRHTRGVSGATDLIRAEEGEVENEEDEGQRDDEIYHGPPTTLLAELQLRKQQQKIRTRPPVNVNGMQSTLLQMDTVLQRQQQSRKQKRVNLAWQIGNNDDPDAEEDEDVPLAMLNVTRAHAQETNRPLGLMEKRSPALEEDEGETLAQRIRRLKERGGTATGLPATRPVSGDFASELMSQLGGDLMNDDGKGKENEILTAPVNEEEETLGQRRKRLQAEREAREKEVGTAGDAEVVPEPLVINKMNSMADILSSHPAAGASRNSSFSKPSRPAAGLLGIHEKQSQLRATTINNLITQQNSAPRRVHSGTHNDPYAQGQAGMIRPHTSSYNLHNSTLLSSGYPQFAQQASMNPMTAQYGNAYPNMAYQHTMSMGGYNNMMPMQMQMQNIHTNPITGMHTGPGGEPLNQGQLDMVERWRQSVMH